MRTLSISVKPESFFFKDGELVIEIDEDQKIEVLPSGIFRGYHWFKNISLHRLGDIVHERLCQMKDFP